MEGMAMKIFPRRARACRRASSRLQVTRDPIPFRHGALLASGSGTLCNRFQVSHVKENSWKGTEIKNVCSRGLPGRIMGLWVCGSVGRCA